jgi:transglutaminase-like putative cysteine protease
MLKTGDLGGKCADLNALYVGLARAVGLPALDVYGIRIAPSKFGYRSLGAGSEIVKQGAALSGRGIPDRVRLGSRRSGRRSQGRLGRAAGPTCPQ